MPTTTRTTTAAPVPRPEDSRTTGHRTTGGSTTGGSTTGRRRASWIAVVLALGCSAALAPPMAAPAHARTSVVRSHDQVSTGPSSAADVAAPQAAGSSNEQLTAADRDLLVKVRLAGLWEMPAGRMAADKGVSPRVREIGAMIASQHAELDALVVRAAAQVGVTLPAQPNADQQRWLGEMAAASGRQFDQVFVDRLRAAHGKVFPVIAQVRVGTRNAVVRRLAQSANGFVLGHLTMLESTGLVQYSTLPLPPQPSVAPVNRVPSQPVSQTATTGLAESAVVLVLFLGATGALYGSRRLLDRRQRRRGDRRPPARHIPAPYPPAPYPPSARRQPPGAAAVYPPTEPVPPGTGQHTVPAVAAQPAFPDDWLQYPELYGSPPAPSPDTSGNHRRRVGPSIRS